MARCKECGFRIRGKNHNDGVLHNTKKRRIGFLPKDDKGVAYPRVEVRH